MSFRKSLAVRFRAEKGDDCLSNYPCQYRVKPYRNSTVGYINAVHFVNPHSMTLCDRIRAVLSGHRLPPDFQS